MSGPKTSRYSLTPEQRRILEEQRKIALEKDLFVNLKKNTISIIVEAERIIEQMEPLYSENGENADSLVEAKKLHEQAVTALNRSSSVVGGNELSILRERNRSLSISARKLADITKILKTEYVSADRAFRTEMAVRIDGGFNFMFDDIGDTSSVINSPFTKTIQSELANLAVLPLTDEQKAGMEVIQEKFAEIDDPGFLKNFYAMTVLPFAKKCRAYHSAYASYGEEYERKCFIYETNVRKLGIVPAKIAFSSDAVAALDERIKEMEDAIQHQDEQAYISRCVDEAMQEMGYSVVGNREVVRRNGKRYRNELYLFDEGTAVNVTYSDDGQITMELGGIATEDRIPNAAESASLLSDMRTFCDDYCEIERRLRKKGIITKRISVLPPDAEYAQIINVSDYDLNADITEYEVKSAKKHTEKSNTRRFGE